MKRLVSILCFITFCGNLAAQYYFPPKTGDTWETMSPDELGWCQDSINSLYSFLDAGKSKGFIVLKDGKIVLEKYFNGHTKDSSWYWASAGKTMASFLIGRAQEQNCLKITDTTSKYLGTGWTSAPLEKENLITCKNLLSMNSGLDDSLGDDVSTENLQYTADAGTRWAYHNVYKKMQDVITTASNETWNNYFNTTEWRMRIPICYFSSNGLGNRLGL